MTKQHSSKELNARVLCDCPEFPESVVQSFGLSFPLPSGYFINSGHKCTKLIFSTVRCWYFVPVGVSPAPVLSVSAGRCITVTRCGRFVAGHGSCCLYQECTQNSTVPLDSSLWSRRSRSQFPAFLVLGPARSYVPVVSPGLYALSTLQQIATEFCGCAAHCYISNEKGRVIAFIFVLQCTKYVDSRHLHD
jgi:hypothetical protein